MPYRLLAHEPPATGLRRIADEQLRAARARLEKSPPDPQEAVHEVRKRLKKVRAVLRLVREGIGEALFAEENARYRELGRLLAPVRDSHTRVEAVRALRKRHGGVHAQSALQDMEDLLRAERARCLVEYEESVRRRALSALRGIGGGPEAWPFDGRSFETLRPGLLRVYRQGRARMRAAWSRPSPDRFHDWRKRAKVLGYQIRILEPASPAALGPTKEALRDMTALLGEAHDLADLEAAVGSFGPSLSNGTRRAWLGDLVAQRCAVLHARAGALGERVYAEEPDAFVDRIASYWVAWRRQEVPPGESA